MKTAQFIEGHIKITDVPDIELNGRKGAIVKVLGCGLCGSDIVKFSQNLVQNGTVLGHEIVAQIIEISSDTQFKVGDVIVTTHHIPCGKCNFCLSGNVSMCKHFKSTNLEPGGFSEKVFLSEEHLQNVAYLKPENLTDIEASFYEPLACCVRAVRRAELKKDSKVLVLGLGSIGILMSQILKNAGMEVLGCDLLEKRVDLLKSFGVEAMQELPENYLPDAVFLTAGADKTVDIAVKRVRDGGKIVVFASTPNNFPILNNEIYYRELTVMGSYSPDLSDMKDSLELLRTGKVQVKGLSTIYDLNTLETAINDIKSAKILKAYVKI